MVNQVILDYLKRHSEMYSIEDLKNKIIATGYSAEEVDEAARTLGLEASGQVIEKNLSKLNFFEKKDFAKKSFKWMKFAGIIGIVFLVIGILSSIASIVLPFFYMPSFDAAIMTEIFSFLFNPIFIAILIILFLLMPLALIVFYKGFSKMGKLCESKLLRFSSLAFIFLIILLIIFGLMSMVFLIVFGAAAANLFLENSSSRSGLVVGSPIGSAINTMGVNLNSFGSLGYILIIGILLLVLFIFLNAILFFIGLIKIGKKVKFAKIAGIFGLVLFLASIGFSIGLFLNPLLLTAIIGSGFGAFFIGSIFLSLCCLVLLFMTLSLFDASRNFEGN